MAERVEMKAQIKGEKVTLKFAWRWSGDGPIKDRQSITLSRRELERALRDAEIVIPWDRLFRGAAESDSDRESLPGSAS